MSTVRGIEEKETLEGRALTRSAETSVTAMAETAKAMVQARFLVALNRPRNFDAVRIKLLDTCKRPRFASTARYLKPIGSGSVEGMSIRFADEAVKLLGNIDTRQEVIYEDEEQRIVQVSVTDLETNLSKSDTICIKKIIERKSVREGQEVIGQRENTKGETVYIIKTSDDALITKEANLCAKKRRNLELQVIPQDLIEECEEAVKSTLANEDAQDPDGARKRIIDGFAAFGIMPEQLQEYLGHSTKSISPAEFDALRKIGAGIRDEQTTWAEVMKSRNCGNGKADRATVNLDDIKPGNPDSHTPVDKPVTPPRKTAATHPDDIKRRDEALAMIDMLQKTRPDDLEDLLAAKDMPPYAHLKRDTTDAKEIVAVIRTAAEFKPGKGS